MINDYKEKGPTAWSVLFPLNEIVSEIFCQILLT